MFEKQNEGKIGIGGCLVIAFIIAVVGLFGISLIPEDWNLFTGGETEKSPDVEIFLYSFPKKEKIENGQEKESEVVIMGIFKEPSEEKSKGQAVILKKDKDGNKFELVAETFRGKFKELLDGLNYELEWDDESGYKFVSDLKEKTKNQTTTTVTFKDLSDYPVFIARGINLNKFLRGGYLSEGTKTLMNYLEDANSNTPYFSEFSTTVRNYYYPKLIAHTEEDTKGDKEAGTGTQQSKYGFTPGGIKLLKGILVVILLFLLIWVFWVFRDRILDRIRNFLEGLPPSRKQLQMKIEELMLQVQGLDGIAQQWVKSSKSTSMEFGEGNKSKGGQKGDTQKGSYPTILELQEQISQMDIRLGNISGDISTLDMSVRGLKEEREEKNKEITEINTKLTGIDDNSEKIEANSKRIEELTFGIKESVETINKLDQKFSEMNSSLEKSILKLEQSIKDEKDLKPLKDWYQKIAKKICDKYIESNPPPYRKPEKEIPSDEKMGRIEKIWEIVTELQDQLPRGEEYQEVLKIVKDFNERVEMRAGSLQGKMIAPKIEKKIEKYDKFENKTQEEILKDIITQGTEKEIDISRLPSIPNIIEAYQRYVEKEGKKCIEDFAKELNTQKASILETDTHQQKVYDDFLSKDLINLFIDSIDGIKRTTKKESILEEIENSLKKIFDIVEIEEIPIEVNKTKADSKLHIIDRTIAGDYEEGIVVELISRGLRDKNTKKDIRKPVVIRGEKG